MEEEKRDIDKHMLEYQSRYVTLEYCGKCGLQLQGRDEYCPECGLWLLVHDDAIITDEERAKELRKEFNDSR